MPHNVYAIDAILVGDSTCLVSMLDETCPRICPLNPLYSRCSHCEHQRRISWHLDREVRVPLMGKLFTHIASPVFSAPRKWGTEGSMRTGPI